MPKVWPLAGCHLTAPRQATTLFHRSGLQHARACLLCRLLTAAGRSGRMAPPSVLNEDTPQISRGQRSDLPCIDAGCRKYAPPVDGGLYGRVPTCPERSTPPIRFVSLAPHVRSTQPSDPASRRRPGASLVLRLHAYLDGGRSPPSMTACTAHTLGISRALQRVGSMPWFGAAQVSDSGPAGPPHCLIFPDPLSKSTPTPCAWGGDPNAVRPLP
jgi:hypothetical protein